MSIIRFVIVLLLFGCKKGTYIPYPVYFNPHNYTNTELYFNEVDIDSFKVTLNKFESSSYCIEVYSDYKKYYLFWYNFGKKIDISDLENTSSSIHEKLILNFCKINDIVKDIQEPETTINKREKNRNIIKSIQVANINKDECFIRIEIIYEHNYIHIYSILKLKDIQSVLNVYDDVKFRNMNKNNKFYKEPIPLLDSRYE